MSDIKSTPKARTASDGEDMTKPVISAYSSAPKQVPKQVLPQTPDVIAEPPPPEIEPVSDEPDPLLQILQDIRAPKPMTGGTKRRSVSIEPGATALAEISSTKQIRYVSRRIYAKLVILGNVRN
jgi:hypothetical protein